MPQKSRETWRIRAALLAAAFTAATATVAVVLLPHLGLAGTAALIVAGAATAAAASWELLARLSRLSSAARQLAQGKINPNEFPQGTGEFSAFTAAVQALADRAENWKAREAEVAAAYRSDLASLAIVSQTLIDPKATYSPPNLNQRYPELAVQLRDGLAESAKELTALRQRLNTAYRILATIPDAIVVADVTGHPRYMNAAAERLFGVNNATAQQKPVVALFADPLPHPAEGQDPERPIVGSGEILDWLQSNLNAPVVVRTMGHALVELSGAASRKGTRDVLTCLVGRELSHARQIEAESRATVRANTLKRFLDRYLQETEEPLRQLTSQFRLLTGDAKQSGQRDVLLNKLNAATQGLHRIEAYFSLAKWFRDLVWRGLPNATPSEFMAVEPVNGVATRLASRLKARGNSLKVVDQGGWLYADADRIEGAILGLLTHVCDATSNAQIELRITRHGAGTDQREPLTEYSISDAGPSPGAAALAVLDRPFGEMHAAALHQFEGLGGCPLGLIVASWMATTLDGEFRATTNEAGLFSLQLFLPTRVASDPTATIAAAAPGALDVAPLEETIAGWRLGAPGTQLPA